MDMKEIQESLSQELVKKGYSSLEVCFNVKVKRSGVFKWLENKRWIKPKTQGFALMVRDWQTVDILSNVQESVVEITNTKINGLR